MRVLASVMGESDSYTVKAAPQIDDCNETTVAPPRCQGDERCVLSSVLRLCVWTTSTTVRIRLQVFSNIFDPNLDGITTLYTPNLSMVLY